MELLGGWTQVVGISRGGAFEVYTQIPFLSFHSSYWEEKLFLACWTWRIACLCVFGKYFSGFSSNFIFLTQIVSEPLGLSFGKYPQIHTVAIA